MDKARGWVNNILLELCRMQSREWRDGEKPTEDALKGWNQLTSAGRVGLGEEELEVLLKPMGEEDRKAFQNIRNRFIFLPPVRRVP